jgi:putative ABC transport system permease protein
MLPDDLRHAIRRLRSQPGTAVLAAGMLALAVGVTSAMFTLADHMLLRPAPFPDPSRLVAICIGKDLRTSQPDVGLDVIRAWRSISGFSAVHAIIQDPVVVEGKNGPAITGAVWVTPGTFELLGVPPVRGRSFAPGEGRPGADDLVVISDLLWRNEYDADPSIIGRRVTLDGLPATVIGVMPGTFRFPFEQVRVWRPFDLDALPVPLANQARISAWAYARLAGGVPAADAARLATVVGARAMALTPEQHVILRGVADDSLDAYSRTAIVVLGAGVGLVFLVLCANVTNLILARTTARREEFAVCAALGASRGRLLWQAFLEHAVVGMAGCAVGVAAAWGLVSISRVILPEAFLLSTLNPLALDLRALAAAVGLGLLSTVGAGLPPAWIGTRLNTADSLRLASRGGTETRTSRSWTRTLLVGEVALASALLVGAGVLVRSFVKLTAQDPGLDLRHVTTAYVTLPSASFPDRPSRSTFAQDLREQVQALPGVSDVALSRGLPPSAGGFSTGQVETDVSGAPAQRLTVLSYDVGPDFFHVYGIALRQGRSIQAGDDPSQVVVSEGLARMLWPGMSAIGHTFKFAWSKAPYRVVGVSHEVRNTLSDPREDLPEFYQPLALGSSQVMIGLRCDARCPDEGVIRDRIRAVSPRAIVYRLQPLETAYLAQFARPRAAAGLALAFASVSVAAAAGGLFSVLSYAVGRRRREFGIRAALGAQPQRLRWLVFRDGMLVAAVGLAIGGGAAWALSKSLATLAFGVTALDPVVWLSVVSIIAAATVAAAWRPAVQAMGVDPLSLLREE